MIVFIIIIIKLKARDYSELQAASQVLINRTAEINSFSLNS
jgi:hypothetical protein